MSAVLATGTRPRLPVRLGKNAGMVQCRDQVPKPMFIARRLGAGPLTCLAWARFIRTGMPHCLGILEVSAALSTFCQADPSSSALTQTELPLNARPDGLDKPADSHQAETKAPMI